jgi:hypothetical protein
MACDASLYQKTENELDYRNKIHHFFSMILWAKGQDI